MLCHSLLASSADIPSCPPSRPLLLLLSAWGAHSASGSPPPTAWTSGSTEVQPQWSNLLQKTPCPLRTGLLATAVIHSLAENCVRCWGMRNTCNNIQRESKGGKNGSIRACPSAFRPGEKPDGHFPERKTEATPSTTAWAPPLLWAVVSSSAMSNRCKVSS